MRVCRKRYYPQWSSRGMRSVPCNRPAKFTLPEPPEGWPEHVCGIHANEARRMGVVVWPGIFVPA